MGKDYTISGFKSDEDAVLRRFFELGFCVGQKVKISAKSMQNKVFLIEIRKYLLSVRASLLDKILVEE